MSLLTRIVGLVRQPLSEVRGLVAESTRRDPQLSLVRWRKRPWSTITPSKLFRVRVTPVQDEAELAERKIQEDHYNTQMRSIREYLKEDLARKAALLTNRSQIDVERRHLESCLKENEVFNQRSAEFRNARESAERKVVEERKLAELIQLEQAERKRLEAAREEVRKAMSVASQFISRENLDSAIEQALNTRQTYNFAIDKEGNRLVEQTDGSTVLVEKKQEETDATEGRGQGV